MTDKKSYNFAVQLLIVTLFNLSISACGGGADSGPDLQGSTLSPDLVDTNTQVEIPIVTETHCIDSGADPLAAFENVTVEAGLCYTPSVTSADSPTSRISGGIAVADYDADGKLDIYVTHGRNGPGRLFKQSNTNHFSEVTAQAGIVVQSIDRGAAFIDINQDGRPDLVSIQDGPSLLQIFANNGDGSFSDISATTGINLTKPAFSVAAGDYDLDGDLDLFFAHWLTKRTDNPGEFLWQNQGDTQFIDNSEIVDIQSVTGAFLASDRDAEMEYSFTPIFADINDDRYPDMLLTGDFNSSQLLLNNGGSGLVDMTTDLFSDQAGMGAAVADYDNDGDLDWFVSAIGDPIAKSLANAAYSGNRLYKNDGFGNFTDATDEAGVRQGHWGWGSCFADFNNDGHQDLFVVNGYDGMTEEDKSKKIYAIFNDDPVVLYINNGDGTFTERAHELGVLHTAMGRGLACFDYDRDGDQDMLIANSGAAPSLYRNNSFATENNFLNVRLQGPLVNSEGVGARIYIVIDGQQRMTELQLGNQYLSQNPIEAHFGLGQAVKVDLLRVVWPGLEGAISEMHNVEANQFLLIDYPN